MLVCLDAWPPDESERSLAVLYEDPFRLSENNRRPSSRPLSETERRVLLEPYEEFCDRSACLDEL